LLAVLPRSEVDALEEFLEGHALPTYLCVIHDAQQNLKQLISRARSRG
jgi:hypothetical protein